MPLSFRSVPGFSNDLRRNCFHYGVLSCARRQTVAKKGSSKRTGEEKEGKEEEEQNRGRGQCGNS